MNFGVQRVAHSVKKGCEQIPGYSYGTGEVAGSPVSLRELDDLKISAGFKKEDQRYLRLAAEVLADTTGAAVSCPAYRNLARHSRSPEGNAIPTTNRKIACGTRSKLNETIKPCLAAKGHSDEQVDKMHGAWRKLIEIQLALWVAPYADTRQAPNEW